MSSVSLTKLKRVALIQPPQEGWDSSLPVGLLALASYIKQYGYQLIIIDLDILRNGSEYPPDFFKQAAEKILSCRPQVLGFSVMCNTLPTTLLIAEECKKLAPQLPIIFGGPEVCFEEIEVLETFKQINIIVRGEGEITLVEVLKALENKKNLSDILGITFRENNRIIRNPDRPFIKDLDDLPYLDFSLLPHIEKYKKVRIEAGRGCPFNCTFCSTCKVWKRNFRIKSPKRLLEELKQVYCTFKKDENFRISLIHDNFLSSRKAAEEFLSLTADENLTWSCSVRFEALDETLVKRLKQAGCRRIFLGIESGSPEMQKEIKKNLPLPRLPQILEMLSQNDIQAVLSFIMGFPGERISQINQTVLMALRLRLNFFGPSAAIWIHPFTFLKGSELYNKAKEKVGQAEFWVPDMSPLLTDLPAERALIKKYPHIFPSFYYMGNDELLPEILQKICLLFNFLIDFFPRTTLALLDFFSATPSQLWEKIIPFFEEKNVDWTRLEGSFIPHFLPAFIVFVHENSNQLMKILVKELSYKMNLGSC